MLTSAAAAAAAAAAAVQLHHTYLQGQGSALDRVQVCLAQVLLVVHILSEQAALV